MKPTVPRIVLYRLSVFDAQDINRRRVPRQPDVTEGPQYHVGNSAYEGDQLPLLIEASLSWQTHASSVQRRSDQDTRQSPQARASRQPPGRIGLGPKAERRAWAAIGQSDRPWSVIAALIPRFRAFRVAPNAQMVGNATKRTERQI